MREMKRVLRVRDGLAITVGIVIGAGILRTLAYQSVAFAYYGWEDAAKMAEEIRDPGRSLPRILIGCAITVAILYLMVNTAYLAALTPDEMAGSELVARDAVQGVFGSTAATFVVVASLLILISSGNVNFLGMPRVAFALARAGLAPKVFRYVSPRGTPVAGLLLIGIVILVLASTGALEFLIQFMMLVAISVDLMVLSAFFRLRRTRSDLERPLRVPGGLWTAGRAKTGALPPAGREDFRADRWSSTDQGRAAKFNSTGIPDPRAGSAYADGRSRGSR